MIFVVVLHNILRHNEINKPTTVDTKVLALPHIRKHVFKNKCFVSFSTSVHCYPFICLCSPVCIFWNGTRLGLHNIFCSLASCHHSIPSRITQKKTSTRISRIGIKSNLEQHQTQSQESRPYEEQSRILTATPRRNRPASFQYNYFSTYNL